MITHISEVKPGIIAVSRDCFPISLPYPTENPLYR